MRADFGIMTPRRTASFFTLALVALFSAATLTGAGCDSTGPSAQVRPTSEDRYHDALAQRLEQSGPTEIAAKVSLTRWLSIDELGTLLGATNAPHLTGAKLLLPDIEDGYRVRIDTTSFDAEVIMAGLYTNADRLAALNPTTAALIHEVQAERVRVGTLTVSAAPADLLSWWKRHPNEIRFVHPATNVLDEAQTTFEPGEPVP
jgi:hypothetical protein